MCYLICRMPQCSASIEKQIEAMKYEGKEKYRNTPQQHRHRRVGTRKAATKKEKSQMKLRIYRDRAEDRNEWR